MKLDRLVHQSAGYLALADVMSVDESLTFDVAAIEDILMMTPNAWHLTDAHRCRAAALTRLTVTVSFRVAVLRQARQVTNGDVDRIIGHPEPRATPQPGERQQTTVF